MNSAKPGTAQARGYAWDRELANRLGKGARAHPGSGNRILQLDAGQGLLLASGKHTDADSMRVTQAMIDETVAAVLGPEAMQGGYNSFLAVHFGEDLSGPALAVLDLDLYISQIKAPPAIVPSTKRDDQRATSRLPSFMRD